MDDFGLLVGPRQTSAVLLAIAVLLPMPQVLLAARVTEQVPHQTVETVDPSALAVGVLSGDVIPEVGMMTRLQRVARPLFSGKCVSAHSSSTTLHCDLSFVDVGDKGPDDREVAEASVTAEVRNIQRHPEKTIFSLAELFHEKAKGPNIVQYFGSRRFQTSSGSRKGALLLERPDASLQDVLQAQEHGSVKMSERLQFSLTVGMLRGLTQLASAPGKIVHRNVAPKSVLIFGNKWRRGREVVAKIGGLGYGQFARNLANGMPNNQWVDPAYTAPECFRERFLSIDSWANTDVWSAGVTLTQLYSGSLPQGWRRLATKSGWKNDPEEAESLLKDHIRKEVKDEQVQDVLLKMVDIEPLQRIPIEEALEDFEHIAKSRGVPIPPAPTPAKEPTLMQQALGMPEELFTSWMSPSGSSFSFQL